MVNSAFVTFLLFSPLTFGSSDPLAKSKVSTDEPTQSIGGLKFSMGLQGLHCLHESDFLYCRTGETSVPDELREPSKVLLFASKPNGLKITDPYSTLKDSYSEMLRDKKSGKPKCDVRKVKNSHGLIIRLRYCMFSLASAHGKYTTFVRMEISEKARQEGTRFAISYQGMSLEKTASLLEAFLSSIQSGPKP